MKISLPDSLTPSRISHVFMHWQNGDLIVRRKNDESVNQLNITAAFIWQHCDGNMSLGEKGMFGIWGDRRTRNVPDAEPFDVPMQGQAACR